MLNRFRCFYRRHVRPHLVSGVVDLVDLDKQFAWQRALGGVAWFPVPRTVVESFKHWLTREKDPLRRQPWRMWGDQRGQWSLYGTSDQPVLLFNANRSTMFLNVDAPHVRGFFHYALGEPPIV